MSNSDKWWMGFFTLWIVLCAGDPDVLDGLVHLMMAVGS
jgi:hypothetical protein